MPKEFNTSLLILFAAVLLFGCAAKNPKTDSIEQDILQISNSSPCEQIPTTKYVNKIDNFIVIFDPSNSMNEHYLSIQKFSIAKHLLKNINQTIPDFKLTG